LGLTKFYSEVSNFIAINADDQRNNSRMKLLYEAALGLNANEVRKDTDDKQITIDDPLFQQFLAWKELMIFRQHYN
jgi:hypothetical protein